METGVSTMDPIIELIQVPFAPYFRARFPVDYTHLKDFQLAIKWASSIAIRLTFPSLDISWNICLGSSFNLSKNVSGVVYTNR